LSSIASTYEKGREENRKEPSKRRRRVWTPVEDEGIDGVIQVTTVADKTVAGIGEYALKTQKTPKVKDGGKEEPNTFRIVEPWEGPFKGETEERKITI
jgi:hypothetical protein